MSSQCYIAQLPPELILEIAEYVRIHPWDGWGQERISTQSRSRVCLSRLAQVSRQFYEPAMSVLWREVHISPAGPMDEYLLQHLDGFTRRIPRFIRTIHLTVVKYWGKDKEYFETM